MLLLEYLNFIGYVSHQSKILQREKMSSDSENLIALILINSICYSKSKTKNKTRNKKDQKLSE